MLCRLRLHPASPQTQRVVLQDDIIPLSRTVNGMNTVTVKRGQVHVVDSPVTQNSDLMQIFIIPFTPMNTNPNAWGQSSTIFDPSRWLDKERIPSPNELPHGWSGLATFCDGPRNCLGWRLGKKTLVLPMTHELV